MLDVLADDLAFRILDELARWGPTTSKDLGEHLKVSDSTAISKRITKLVNAGLVRKGSPQELLHLEQTIRTLDEIGRLEVLAINSIAAERKKPYYSRARDLGKTHRDWAAADSWEPVEIPQPTPVQVHWQKTYQEGGPIEIRPRDGGVLVKEDREHPQAVVNLDFFGFRLLIAGLTAGDLDLTIARATARVKWAIESIVPTADDTQLLSYHEGWRDATEQVYNDHMLGEQLRKYRRRADGGNSTGSR